MDKIVYALQELEGHNLILLPVLHVQTVNIWMHTIITIDVSQSLTLTRQMVLQIETKRDICAQTASDMYLHKRKMIRQI